MPLRADGVAVVAADATPRVTGAGSTADGGARGTGASAGRLGRAAGFVVPAADGRCSCAVCGVDGTALPMRTIARAPVAKRTIRMSIVMGTATASARRRGLAAVVREKRLLGAPAGT